MNKLCLKKYFKENTKYCKLIRYENGYLITNGLSVMFKYSFDNVDIDVSGDNYFDKQVINIYNSFINNYEFYTRLYLDTEEIIDNHIKIDNEYGIDVNMIKNAIGIIGGMKKDIIVNINSSINKHDHTRYVCYIKNIKTSEDCYILPCKIY